MEKHKRKWRSEPTILERSQRNHDLQGKVELQWDKRDHREKIASIRPCVRSRTEGADWDLAISKDSEVSWLRLQQLEKYRTPKLIPLAVCWGSGVVRPTGANGSILCLLEGWLMAESHYMTQTGV